MKKTKGKRFKENNLKIRKSKKIQKKFSMAGQHSNKDKKNTKNKKTMYNIIISICLVVIAFSLYEVISWAIENNKNNTLLSDIQSNINITHEEIIINEQPIVKSNYDFSNLLQTNPQTIGWVHVPNTKIDYPVVQTNDNDFYLTHSFDKSNNSAGWVFADYTCDIKNSQNVIIYGHNRRDTSMFGSLKSVLDDNWRANIDNNYISFANLDDTGIYKIFSVFICNDEHVNSYLETDFSSNEALKAYMEKLKNSSMYKFDTDIENAEKMITLYTCYGLNNQRLLVFAVKVN